MNLVLKLGVLALAWIWFGQSAQAQSVEEILGPNRELVHPIWQQYDPEFTPYICPFHAQAPNYDPAEFRCGYVLVPEDRTDQNSRLIQLSVLQIKSTSDNPDRRAVVRLTGGPGGPSLSAGRILAYQAPAQQRFREAADLIFFDQRGIGYSEAHFCRAVPRNFQFGVPTEEGTKQWIEAFEKCIAEAQFKGVSLDAYSTWQNAYDVRDIRRALGYEQWDLYGVSYGTELGQAVLEVDEDGVRAAILDSVVPAAPIESGGWGAVAYGFRSALNSINADCQADPVCARDVGDMTTRFIELFQAYEDDPLVIEGLDHGAFLDGRLVLDGTVAAGAVFQALYINSLYPDFPSLMRAFETRDETAIEAYATVLGRTIDHRYGNGMELIANCRGAVHLTDEQTAAQAAAEPLLSRFMGTLQWGDICERVYRIDPDPAVKTLVTAVPVLVGAGTTDPITPPNYGQAIMPGLINGQYVEFPHTGHGVFVSHFDGCGGDLWLAFLDDPLMPLDTSCVADIEAPKFLTRLIETKAPYRFARKLQAGSYPHGLIALAGLLIITLIMLPAGWAARFIQGRQSNRLALARPLSWGGALVSLFGLGWAIMQILNTATAHPMALPIGVLPSAGWAFWICLIGVGLCAFAVFRAVTSGQFGRAQIGTSIGLVITLLASFGVLVSVASLGLSPV
ncbi:MAG: alpha/beta hydrolase [Hyphomonadaceae bacterium]|nr:alpha/beta hydrolase [Hyphomonadaceae bacterium]